MQTQATIANHWTAPIGFAPSSLSFAPVTFVLLGQVAMKSHSIQFESKKKNNLPLVAKIEE